MPLLFSLPACAQSAAVTPAAAGEAPAKVEKNATTGIAKLTVTEHGLARIDLKTEPVAAGTGTDVLLPYASLLYDANGKTWVYTNPAPRVFERRQSPSPKSRQVWSRPAPAPPWVLPSSQWAR